MVTVVPPVHLCAKHQCIYEKFKAMVQKAVTDTEDLLWDRLMWTLDPSGRLVLDIEKLTDDVIRNYLVT